MIECECTDMSGNLYIPTEDYQDQIRISNLKDYKPSERITINNKCYDIDNIYRWVIT